MSQKTLFVYGTLFALLLAACSPAAEPTRPPTATPIPTYNYVEPTTAPQMATALAPTNEATSESVAVSLDPVKVERGRDRYEVLECGTCHGDQGQGTDQASALVNTELNEGEFITFLRTGGSLGNAHLYSTDRLSDNGGRNLYQFILSLGTAGAEQTPDA